jgi:YVTN family beta-propeller protein
LENEASIQAIDTATNKVIATIPSGQLPQALVYVPRAAAHSDGKGGLESHPAFGPQCVEGLPVASQEQDAGGSSIGDCNLFRIG